MIKFEPDQEWIDWCNKTRIEKSITISDIADQVNLSDSYVGRALRGIYEISERKRNEIREFLENAKPQKVYADANEIQDALYLCKEIGYSRKYFYQKLEMTSTHFNNIVSGRIPVSQHTLNRLITMMKKIIEE